MCCPPMFSSHLAPRLSGLHRPRTTLHALQGFAKKVSIYENDTTRNSHMQVGSLHVLTNEIVPYYTLSAPGLRPSPSGRSLRASPDLPSHGSGLCSVS